MGSVPVNTGGGGGGGGNSSIGIKDLAEQNYHHRYEHREVRDEVVGEGQGLSEEDELKINEVAKDVNAIGCELALLPQASLQKQQQQPSGSVVRWERFLPLRSLKVLLVENDDSTRHVVSALLRNCSYEVMSSHDSMGIVFKCLSKGAVDFLVKPIRKNELKNLWQHVWRRCHSSSGSGSESGIQTLKSVKSKSIDESDNNTGSNDEDGNSSVGLNVRDGSDNGSGTQSSWTKRAVEVDSPHPMSPWDQLAGPPDSTCLQVTNPKSESFGKEWVPVGAKNECPEHDERLLDNVAMGKDLEIGVSRNASLQQEYTNEKVDFGFSETPNSHPKVSESKDMPSSDPKEVPSLELSLKRLRDVSTNDHDDRKMLKRSDASAFSRYQTGYNSNQAPTGIVGSCSPLDDSSEAMKTDSIYNQRSNESSNNYDMGSTNKKTFTKPAAVSEKSASTSTERCLYPSAFQSVQNSHAGAPLQGMPPKVNDAASNTAAAQPKGAHRQVQVQHHHHYYHHHHHHVHNMQQQQGLPDSEDLSLSIGGSGVQCGSSNMVGGPTESNTGTYSLNGSASGSNHGSSGQNGGTKDVNAGGMNIESDNGLVGKSGVGGSGSGSGSGVDQNRSAQRVAALTKFRQKRKERCFERKVRYQSRKRLAEQRPRVRGQFVRQRVYENTSGEADC
ncbi:hypothetical protein AQUCO_02700140v1 [Aquilegia coerulea]|uniref:CCT domain-containing protein n=1 Tax=Aquilegia coerulea TaxID=218851 RepID=A0A2G5D5E5_AQUCA|nr:hypothetical protein AQUCO_02700140v1 [Aquilegia coerulea]